MSLHLRRVRVYFVALISPQRIEIVYATLKRAEAVQFWQHFGKHNQTQDVCARVGHSVVTIDHQWPLNHEVARALTLGSIKRRPR